MWRSCGRRWHAKRARFRSTRSWAAAHSIFEKIIHIYIYIYIYIQMNIYIYIYIYICMRKLLGWLETRLAQITLTYLKIAARAPGPL